MATTYNPQQVTCMIAGLSIDSGMGEDEFLKIEKDADAYTDKVSADGTVVRVKSNDKRATATLTLMPTAKGNALLSVLHNLDVNTENGAGIGPFLVKDNNSLGTIYEAESCWISRAPDPSFGKDVSMREWKIRIANLRQLDTGY